MKNRIFKLMALAAGMVITSPHGAMAETGTENVDLNLNQQQAVRTSWIFGLSSSVSDAASVATSAVGRVGGRLDHVYTAGFIGFAATMPQQVAQRLLEQNPLVVSLVPDAVITTVAPPEGRGGGGGGGKGGGGGDTPESEIPWSTARVGGPIDCGLSGSNCAAVVYVMDTGVDLDHPDLNVNSTLSHGGCFDDPFGSGSAKFSADDENGHGTHVAGSAGARLNSQGTAGVAAGVTVASLRILDKDGNGLISDALCAVNWLAGNAPSDGRRVIVNMSFMTAEAELGLDTFEQAVKSEAAKGRYFVAAAGNNIVNGPPFIRTNYTAEDLSPARLGSDGSGHVYAVSAVDEQDAMADFSVSSLNNFTSAAPGVGVVSSKMGGGTESKDGTSMAAPHVAGILAACASVGSDGAAKNDNVGEADPIATCQ